MASKESKNLSERVHNAAAAVLKRDGSVGPLELLMQMRFLDYSHFEAWKKGDPHCTPLENRLQCGPEKLAKTYQLFMEWVNQRGLQTLEKSYQRAGVQGTESLQISRSGNPQDEEFFRRHFIPAELSAKQTERLEKKLNKAPDISVFLLTSDRAACHECAVELERDELIFLEKEQPLCLSCADLDHLEFLPSGDAAMSRRARKHSSLAAIVLQFNRCRKRYERRGILVTAAAIAQAEEECAADAPDRAVRREKDVVRRQDEDAQLVDSMTQQILARYPGCPADEARQIATHTAVRGSGRVGRSAAGRSLDDKAIELAVIASIRHQHTDYDQLLMDGTPRLEARGMIREKIQECLRQWSGKRN